MGWFCAWCWSLTQDRGCGRLLSEVDPALSPVELCEDLNEDVCSCVCRPVIICFWSMSWINRLDIPIMSKDAYIPVKFGSRFGLQRGRLPFLFKDRNVEQKGDLIWTFPSEPIFAGHPFLHHFAGKALAIALKTCGCLIAVLEEMTLVEAASMPWKHEKHSVG